VIFDIQDVYDHADDTRLASCIVAILYVVVSRVQILWLNRTSYVRRPSCLFTLFEEIVKYTNFALRYNKTISNWRHQSLLEIFSFSSWNIALGLRFRAMKIFIRHHW